MISNVFIGSSAYALPALEMLCKNGMAPKLVISQPDKPAGRKLNPTPTPVALRSRELGLPLLTPDDINQSLCEIAACNPDILITASYGAYIGRALRQVAPLKTINLHPSLLPRFRGASPIQSVLLAGEKITGTSIFRLVAEMDAGPVLVQKPLEIFENDNYSSLHQRLADQAAEVLIALLQSPLPYPETAQDAKKATLCPKIDASLCQLDWSVPAAGILNKIRAFSYEPGAWVYFRGSKLKLLEARLFSEKPSGEAGTVVTKIKNTGFTINCTDAQILITSVQAAGKKILDAATFVNGARLEPGEKLWM